MTMSVLCVDAIKVKILPGNVGIGLRQYSCVQCTALRNVLLTYFNKHPSYKYPDERHIDVKQLSEVSLVQTHTLFQLWRLGLGIELPQAPMECDSKCSFQVESP